jgi:hypothetical protein
MTRRPPSKSRLSRNATNETWQPPEAVGPQLVVGVLVAVLVLVGVRVIDPVSVAVALVGVRVGVPVVVRVAVGYWTAHEPLHSNELDVDDEYVGL